MGKEVLETHSWAKGFPTFPAHLRMRPASGGNSRRSLEGHTTCQKTPIPWSTFDQNQTPGHLFEGKPVDEGTTRRGTDTPCIFRNTLKSLVTGLQVLLPCPHS